VRRMQRRRNPPIVATVAESCGLERDRFPPHREGPSGPARCQWHFVDQDAVQESGAGLVSLSRRRMVDRRAVHHAKVSRAAFCRFALIEGLISAFAGTSGLQAKVMMDVGGLRKSAGTAERGRQKGRYRYRTHLSPLLLCPSSRAAIGAQRNGSSQSGKFLRAPSVGYDKFICSPSSVTTSLFAADFICFYLRSVSAMRS